MTAKVIFACVHNAGRSQMANAFFNRLADPKQARSTSAGTDPGARVHPEVLAVMREKGIDLDDAKPQRLTTQLATGARLLVTMGCGDACPVVPGLQRDDWPLADPKGQPLARVREIRDEIERRVRSLLVSKGWLRSPSATRASPTLRSATAADLAAIESLLQRVSLPPDGLRDQFPDAYSIAEIDGVLVGAAGLEVYGDAGLLRSVVVADAWRGQGVGEALVRERLERARRRGPGRIYALTTTAASYFLRLGFVPADRAAAPESIKQSPQFASVCPTSAVFLEYRL
jgi:arsenate reductase